MKILVAIDASPASKAALDAVAERPWPPDSRFEILTAVETSQRWALATVAVEMKAHAHQLVDAAAARLRSVGLTASATVSEGDPKPVILDHAAAMAADLIVVGAHGMTALEQFLLGSVSKAILRFAPCSVAIVRKTAGSRILLAIDDSAGSRLAVESVAARPWPAGTEIRVLSAVELGMSALQGAFEIPSLDAKHLETQRAAAMKRTEDAIDSALKILEAAGLATSESISVLAQPPKEIILEEAAAWPADWIVLGSHGSSGLSRFLIGSTSETVATHAPCSVEVVRKKL
ncbi:MAG: universal stress protein [Acidobacteriota bacterium]|nr:universal stress protein [Acidobacteriota bacterium]